MFLDEKTKNNKHAKFPQTQRQVHCYSDWNPYRISESREKNLTFIWKFLKVRMPRTFFFTGKKKRSLLTEKCIKETCLKTLWRCYRNMQVCEWRICHVLSWTFDLLFSTLEQLCISSLTATHYKEFLWLRVRAGLYKHEYFEDNMTI